MDDSYAAIPIIFQSCGARSVLLVEVIVLADLFDDVMDLRFQAQLVICQPVPKRQLTDSKSLFDIIGEGTCTS